MAEISKADQAHSLVKYSRDCIRSGKVVEALAAVNFALSLMPTDDSQAVNNEVLRLFESGVNG